MKTLLLKKQITVSSVRIRSRGEPDSQRKKRTTHNCYWVERHILCSDETEMKVFGQNDCYIVWRKKEEAEKTVKDSIIFIILDVC